MPSPPKVMQVCDLSNLPFRQAWRQTLLKFEADVVATCSCYALLCVSMAPMRSPCFIFQIGFFSKVDDVFSDDF